MKNIVALFLINVLISFSGNALEPSHVDGTYSTLGYFEFSYHQDTWEEAYHESLHIIIDLTKKRLTIGNENYTISKVKIADNKKHHSLDTTLILLDENGKKHKATFVHFNSIGDEEPHCPQLYLSDEEKEMSYDLCR